MVSKARAKFIKSLQLKKYRQSEQAFLVEGTKSVLEVARSSFEIIEILGSGEFLHQVQDSNALLTETDQATLSRLGNFKSNDGALAVVRSRPNQPFAVSRGYTLLLDGINDPGNLGTILRIADWFGLNGLIVSEDVPELYNPKVIAASKGSFCRKPVYYTSLPEFVRQHTLPVFGTDMQGSDVHSFSFPANGLIVVGSEAHGISPEMKTMLQATLQIPGRGKAESLNAGMAAAIVCDNLTRIQGVH